MNTPMNLVVGLPNRDAENCRVASLQRVQDVGGSAIQVGRIWRNHADPVSRKGRDGWNKGCLLE